MACSLFALRGGTRVKRRRCAFVRSLVRLNARRVDACLGTKGLASSRNTFHRQVNTRDTTSRHPRFSANCIIWRNISHEQSHILPVEFARLAVYSLLRISFIEPLCQTMLFLFPLKTYPSNFPGQISFTFQTRRKSIESSLIVVWIGRERNRFFALERIYGNSLAAIAHISHESHSIFPLSWFLSDIYFLAWSNVVWKSNVCRSLFQSFQRS